MVSRGYYGISKGKVCHVAYFTFLSGWINLLVTFMLKKLHKKIYLLLVIAREKFLAYWLLN